jgi:hypothetical protein
MLLKTLKDLDRREYEILGIKVKVYSNITGLRDSLKALYSAFPKGELLAKNTEGVAYSVLEEKNGHSGKRPFVILEGDQPVYRAADEEKLFLYLEWFINGALLSKLDQFYQLHAGVVSKNGKGIILPGPSGSGKTTLVIELLKHGFEYLSDEVALIDPETLKVFPFPRNLYVRKKDADFLSLFQFSGPGKRLSTFERRLNIEVRVPEALVGDPIGVTHVIFPTYSPSEKPQLILISRGAALIKMVKSSLNFIHYGASGIDTLIRLLEKADCFTLTTNNLEETVHLISSLVEQPSRRML